MSVQNPEYREWFNTNENQPLVPQVAGDTPTNQDDPVASKSKQVLGVTIGTIFNENHEPSEYNYRKLFKSVPFKLNKADRAREQPLSFTANSEFYGTTETDVKQGLVTVSTDVQAKANLNGDTNNYTRVPRVSQLPTVQATTNTLVNDFAIQQIPDSPTSLIEVSVDPVVSTRNNFLVKWAQGALTWLKNAFDGVKAYIDTVRVTSGLFNVVAGNTNSITITETPATSSDTYKFKIDLTLGLDDDALLTNNASNKIPSQKAVKAYVDALAATISGTASATDLTNLTTRVNTIQGDAGATLKANKSDLDALAVSVATKLSKTVNDTAAGIITFTQVPLCSTAPTTASGLANKDYVDGKVAAFTYDKATIDGLIAALNVTITNLTNRVAALETKVNVDIPNAYYTKTQSDARFAEINHNHNTLYHPLVPGALTQTNVPLNLMSAVTVSNGIIKQIVS